MSDKNSKAMSIVFVLISLLLTLDTYVTHGGVVIVNFCNFACF